MFRRETIIALRARHQAHRIASMIANPPVESVPRPPEPAIPLDLPNWSPPRQAVSGAMLVLVAVVWALLALYWAVAWFTQGV